MIITLALAGAAAPLGAQATGTGAAAPQGQEETRLPPGWQMRIDPGRRPAPVTMMAMGNGFHLNTGRGSGIFWHPRHQARGEFELQASFAQRNAAEGHAEAYGLVFAGTNLEAENQAYQYFVVRGTGEYMIRHRAGTEVHTIADWTAHPAIVKVGADGSASNDLAVRVGADSVRFVINGQQVMAYSRAQMSETDGQVGLRANHRTELHVGRFEVIARSR
jgi:hypothetical protein